MLISFHPVSLPVPTRHLKNTGSICIYLVVKTGDSCGKNTDLVDCGRKDFHSVSGNMKENFAFCGLPVTKIWRPIPKKGPFPTRTVSAAQLKKR